MPQSSGVSQPEGRLDPAMQADLTAAIGAVVRAAVAAKAPVAPAGSAASLEILVEALREALQAVVEELKEVKRAVSNVQMEIRAARDEARAAEIEAYNLAAAANNCARLGSSAPSGRDLRLIPFMNKAGKLPPPGLFPMTNGKYHDLQSRMQYESDVCNRIVQLAAFYDPEYSSKEQHYTDWMRTLKRIVAQP